MAITTYADYKRRIEDRQFDGFFTKNTVTINGSSLFQTSFTTAPNAGAAPGTTARQCGRATPGNLLGFNPSALTLTTLPLWLAELELQIAGASRQVGNIVLVDRLADVSGMSGIVTTAQTANATPNRYTNGSGVIAAVEVYTGTGATTTTLTMSYTNELGVAGRTSKVIATIASMPAGIIMPIPLADGDRGVQSVQTATLAATTGTAGNFGITLYKPMAVFPTNTMSPDGNSVYRQMLGAMQEHSDDACLEIWLQSNGGTASGVFVGRIGIIEG